MYVAGLMFFRERKEVVGPAYDVIAGLHHAFEQGMLQHVRRQIYFLNDIYRFHVGEKGAGVGAHPYIVGHGGDYTIFAVLCFPEAGVEIIFHAADKALLPFR